MAITLKNVVKEYGALEALHVDSFTFETGKIYGVVGKNGSGKTTLFKSLTTIVHATGEILYDGVDVQQNPAVLRQVGIVLDNLSLYSSWTGLQNIQYFMTLKDNDNMKRVMKLAEKLDLTEALSRKVATYSLGMSKKLILLIALIDDVKVLILDEPFRGIDRESTDVLTDFIKNDFMSPDRLVLISSHVANDIESMATEFVELSAGRVVQAGELKLNNFKVKTAQGDGFATFLRMKNVSYTRKGDEFLMENLDEAVWNVLLPEALAAGVVFTNINKISDVEGVLN
jgi:ABC-2 type transport system ATP-binding protein